MIKLKQLPKLYKQIIQEEFNLLLALLYEAFFRITRVLLSLLYKLFVLVHVYES